MPQLRAGAVFVHGFLSSAATWDQFLALLRRDDDLAALSWLTFQYATPPISMHPLRRVPNLNDVADTHRIVVNQVVHATAVTGSTCPIRIAAYAGDTDAVVTPASARSVFPEVGVLPGDHRSLVRPDSPRHPSYIVLKHHLEASLTESPPSPAAPETEITPSPGGDRMTLPSPLRPNLRLRSELVDRLLAVPRMSEPSFRERLYTLLPDEIITQLARDPAARIELFSLLGSFSHYPDLTPWESLATALSTLAPGQVQVDAVVSLLQRSGLIRPAPAG